MKITGTFLDEISHDIPSLNWGRDDWSKDFDVMKSVGIDTVILIRGGYMDNATFDSQVLKAKCNIRPVYIDLLDIFLAEAERCGMTLFFGTYDPLHYNVPRNVKLELEINLDFTREVIERYGARKALGGWYISREISVYNAECMKMFEKLATHLKRLKNMPVLISPAIHGPKQCDDAITPMQHEKEWKNIFSHIKGLVDIVAFQDGHVDFSELPKFMNINTALAKENKIISWSNVESFERGMPIDFLPIDWRHLIDKIETAQKCGVEKLITFEFSHFMSPNSVYRSAHNLYRRYCEWLNRSK